ncbi:MAG: dTDP-glucose 4,6-dehydratase [Micavibrio aeruginosavorus]|uniref:dTDP-glucose 4,6-dehydratase n=1 Tax=Micavibrio aeruginosavorus TaxID=349221 RepID=A0A2W5FPB3_9BACT|nr:MAG: dTDP-glucose 4,6-dehydratase [Micavibrio aeruginosavorus]
MKSVLVTGGAGFIGSHLVDLLMTQDLNVVVLDALTYAGSRENLNIHSRKKNFHFIEGNICDADLVSSLLAKHDIDTVLHLAAESHVDNAIEEPGIFIKTNVEGSYTLLKACLDAWTDTAGKRFLHVSTDEVFGQLKENDPPFDENTPYAPSSPYSASKASSDLLARAWHHTYKFPVIITNCSNNYGARQHDEKLIPTIIRNALGGKIIPIYGTGMNIRDWLYVEDHCKGLIAAITTGELGETYCLGGGNEVKNIDIAHQICAILDAKLPRPDDKSYAGQIQFVTDRKGHDFRYAIDFSKATEKLGWMPEISFQSGLEHTVDYYISLYK